MAYKDLHLRPFDKKTIAKLELFEDYAQAWIPTFVMQKEPEIHIFDFFAGPGYDSRGIPGSPIRILTKIEEQKGNILQNQTKIYLHLNEYEPNRKEQKKAKLLETNCKAFVEKHKKFRYFLEIKYYNEDSNSLFHKLLPSIKSYPSLVFLDQNGVKFISKAYLDKIQYIEKADFLFFVSSSYFWRLHSTPEFKKILDFEKEEIKKTKYSNIHRAVISKLKSKLDENSNFMLFPFSIKKGRNIYGIIFGASHYRAVDKFLEISWNKNKTNGEADFDIDEDQKKGQTSLFGSPKPTKIEKFKDNLTDLILNGTITNNHLALIYTYEEGCFYRHANDLLKKLKKENIVYYDGKTPGINYKYVFKKSDIRMIHYNVIKK